MNVHDSPNSTFSFGSFSNTVTHFIPDPTYAIVSWIRKIDLAYETL
jgi:hypothetical protein